MTVNLCRCGGGRAHHTNDIACWCPRCLPKPLDKRCLKFAPRSPLPLPKPESGSTQEHPATEPLAPKQAAPESEQQVISHITQSGDRGASAGELATYLGLKPHRVKRILLSLEKAGLIALSGQLRSVGDDTEALWLAEARGPSAAQRQATLWE